MRDFDFVSFEHDVLVALGGLASDVASGLPYAVLGGLIGTQTVAPSLSINISAGRIYQFAVSDALATGSIPQDLSIIVQQGFNPAQTLTLAAPSSGQSQWNLVQAQFSQVDAVRAGDPNGGIVPFYNAANPTQPTLNSINTVRKGLCVLQVITGSAATTGSEVPPTPTGGWVPLYMIDLAGGQTQITTGQIIAAGPSVGVGVPANYAVAPFLAGLLAAHHNGKPGQAPKINLATEVQGILPYANMSSVRTLLNAPLTLYVSPAGSDTNSGLTPGAAFRNPQAAANAMYRSYDFNGNSGTISVANGSYSNLSGTGGWVLTIASMPTGMPSGGLFLTGNTASPGSVTFTASSANGIQVGPACFITIQGLTITASGTNTISLIEGYGLNVVGGSATISNIVFGSCGTAQMQSSLAGVIAFTGSPVTLTGSTTYGILANINGYITGVGATLTVSGLSCSIAFIAASLNSSTTVYGNTFVGTATGPRFVVNFNSTINSNAGGANYYPGNSGGVIASASFGSYV